MAYWYYTKDGKRFGPVDDAELQELIAKQGITEWTPAEAPKLQDTPPVVYLPAPPVQTKRTPIEHLEERIRGLANQANTLTVIAVLTIAALAYYTSYLNDRTTEQRLKIEEHTKIIKAQGETIDKLAKYAHSHNQVPYGY